MIADNSLLEKIKRICEAYFADAFAQRHHFWMKYAKSKNPTPNQKVAATIARRALMIDPKKSSNPKP